jgi:hypothetical protein
METRCAASHNLYENTLVYFEYRMESIAVVCALNLDQELYLCLDTVTAVVRVAQSV